MSQNPQLPMVNLGNLYINGLQMSWASNTVIEIAQGQARDSTDSVDIVLTLPPLNNGSVQTAPFIITNTLSGPGGLDSGVIAPSTSYAVYVIYSSAFSQIRNAPSPESYLLSPPYVAPSGVNSVSQSEGYLPANVLISLSYMSPVLPAGYDSFRRIGAVATNSSSQFVQFEQTGNGLDRVLWFTPFIELPTLSGSTTYVSIGNLYPYIPISATTLQIRAGLISASFGDVVNIGSYGSAKVTTVVISQVTGLDIIGFSIIPTGFNNGVPEVLYTTTSTGDEVLFAIEAYTDSL